MKKIMFYDVEIYNDSRTVHVWQQGTDVFDGKTAVIEQAKTKAFKYSKLTGEISDFKFRVRSLTPLYDLPPEKHLIRRALKKVN